MQTNCLCLPMLYLDVRNEKLRKYTFRDGQSIKIYNPQWVIHTKDSCRILDKNNRSYDIGTNWAYMVRE
jgi:hypothetical protein